MKNNRIVIIDDEQEILNLQRDALALAGLNCDTFSDPLLAWESLQRDGAGLVLSDWQMPLLSGMDLLFRTRSLPVPPYFIIITGVGTIDHAVKALNQGAFSFLEKPFDIPAYLELIKSALGKLEPLNLPARPISKQKIEPRLVYRSSAMKAVIELADSVARSNSTVLLLGESGCGKEVIADYIHQHSPRRSNSCVKVNCGALPENLMESALFGHERGAFTGADRRVIGRFEQANGGTLFLDEIGDLMLSLQVKLLRALQERTVERVGSSTTIPVDFRLVCATHCDLQAAIAQKTFREDLFYRINVVPIHVPPLRDRAEDVEPLAQHFFTTLRATLDSGPTSLGISALKELRAYQWPGNVRQLRNAIEYALVLCKGNSIEAMHLPEDVRRNLRADDTPAGSISLVHRR